MTSKFIYGCAPFQSSIDNRYHYVYRITNLVEDKHYYGSRTSSILPESDLGQKYYAQPKSEKNKWIVRDQKNNPANYKYKILRCFESRKEAVAFEVFVHAFFDVKSHKKFYNESNQTSTGFDTTGCVTVKDKCGNYFNVSKTDPKLLSGEYIASNTGRKIPNEKIRKNYTRSEETKTKIKDSLAKDGGLIWINDGTQNRHLRKNVPMPIGWKNGKVGWASKQNSTKGTKYYNNGSVNRKFKEGEQPQNWIKGRLKK